MDLPAYTVADGRVDDLLHRCDKALNEGKWEKALALAVAAMAWQRQRDEARTGRP
jgi:hypothetical protein